MGFNSGFKGLIYISLGKNREAQNCVRCDVRSSHGKQVEEYGALECDVTQSDRRQHQGSTQICSRGQQVLPKLDTYPLNYTVAYLSAKLRSSLSQKIQIFIYNLIYQRTVSKSNAVWRYPVQTSTGSPPPSSLRFSLTPSRRWLGKQLKRGHRHFCSHFFLFTTDTDLTAYFLAAYRTSSQFNRTKNSSTVDT